MHRRTKRGGGDRWHWFDPIDLGLLDKNDCRNVVVRTKRELLKIYKHILIRRKNNYACSFPERMNERMNERIKFEIWSNRSSNDAFNIASSEKRWKVKQKKWSTAFPLPDRENRLFQVKCKQKLWFLVSCGQSLPDGNISRCNTWHCDFNALVCYDILTKTILLN